MSNGEIMDTQNIEIIETLFYISDEGAETIEVIVGDETLWATQKSMSTLFDVGIPAINKHLKKYF